jgi:hypothetical protein
MEKLRQGPMLHVGVKGLDDDDDDDDDDFYKLNTTNNLGQMCTNSGLQNAMETHFCTVAPNTCGCLVRNLLCVILLEPRRLMCFLDFWKIRVFFYLIFKKKVGETFCSDI